MLRNKYVPGTPLTSFLPPSAIVGGMAQAKIDDHEQRADMRLAADCRAVARVALPVTVVDVSHLGVRVRAGVALRVGSELNLSLPGELIRHARIVWGDGEMFGCEFAKPLTDAELLRVSEATRDARPRS